MKSNNAQVSSKRSIDLLTGRFGKNTGGIISVDHRARFGISYNTKSMPRAMITKKNEKPAIAI